VPQTNQSVWPLMNVHAVVEQIVSGKTVRY